MNIQKVNKSPVITINQEFKVYIDPCQKTIDNLKSKAIILNTNTEDKEVLFSKKDNIVLNISGSGEFEVNHIYVQSFAFNRKNTTEIAYLVQFEGKKFFILTSSLTEGQIGKTFLADESNDLAVIAIIKKKAQKSVVNSIEKLIPKLFIFLVEDEKMLQVIKKDYSPEETKNVSVKKSHWTDAVKHSFILT